MVARSVRQAVLVPVAPDHVPSGAESHAAIGTVPGLDRTDPFAVSAKLEMKDRHPGAGLRGALGSCPSKACAAHYEFEAPVDPSAMTRASGQDNAECQPYGANVPTGSRSVYFEMNF